VAPDCSDVRVLLGLAGGGMAEFELGAGKVSAAVTHRTIDGDLVCPRRPRRVLGVTMPPGPAKAKPSS